MNPLAPLRAFAYPESTSLSNNWLKNAALFFDDLGVLLPDVFKDEFFQKHDWLAEPLIDAGMMTILRAEEIVDSEMSGRLALSMNRLMDRKAFAGRYRLDELSELGRRALHGTGQVAMARVGREDNPQTQELISRLEREGLTLPSGALGSVEMNVVARAVLLTLIPLIHQQMLKERGEPDRVPLATSTLVIRAVEQTLKLPPINRLGEVITLDLELSSVDLCAVPLDELIDFRNRNRDLYRRYLRSAEVTAVELAPHGPEERERLLNARIEEIEDLAYDVRTASRQWKRPLAGLAIGLTGAGWSATHGGDPTGGLLAALGAAVGFSKPTAPQSSFSYLLELRRLEPRVRVKFSKRRRRSS